MEIELEGAQYVFGDDEVQARDVALEIAKNAFHNVTYFAGDYENLAATLTGQ